jgi:hypothetical protein
VSDVDQESVPAPAPLPAAPVAARVVRATASQTAESLLSHTSITPDQEHKRGSKGRSQI